MASETPSTALSVARARPMADQPAPARPAEKCRETSRVSIIGTSARLSPGMAPPASPAPGSSPVAGPAPSWPAMAPAPLSPVTGPPRSGVRGQRVPAGIRAAVHLQDRAGDVGGRIRGEEQHRLGDIPRIASAAERNGLDEGRPQLVRRAVRVRVAPLAHVDVAGGDDVYPDPVRAELHGEDLAHRF